MGNNIDIQTSVVNEKQIELLKATRLQDGTTALDYVMSNSQGDSPPVSLKKSTKQYRGEIEIARRILKKYI